MNLEFIEIASVALLPRNDAGNSKFFVMRSPDQVGGWQKTQARGWHRAVKLGMTQGLGNSRIFVIASEAKQSHLLSLIKPWMRLLPLLCSLAMTNFRRNFEWDCGNLNEIASSFVSLTPRNDGIPQWRNFRQNFRILCDEILGSSPRMTKKSWGMTKKSGRGMTRTKEF